MCRHAGWNLNGNDTAVLPDSVPLVALGYVVGHNLADDAVRKLEVAYINRQVGKGEMGPTFAAGHRPWQAAEERSLNAKQRAYYCVAAKDGHAGRNTEASWKEYIATTNHPA